MTALEYTVREVAGDSRAARSPSQAEVELIVGLFATVCTYLTKKYNQTIRFASSW